MKPLRVVVADDETLLRGAVVALLDQAGFEIAAEAVDVPGALDAVRRHRPDVAILDIRMPGPSGQNGLTVAKQLRSELPEVSVMMLSSQVTTLHLGELLDGDPRGFGYLLKSRVVSIADFVESVRRVAAGECAIDPEVVAQLLRPTGADPLARLSAREREVLTLVAEGLSNFAIGERLFLSQRTVESHIANIFRVLDIPSEAATNRRVMAVLSYIDRADGSPREGALN